MVDRQEFLDTIFGDIEDNEFVCVSEAKPKKDGDGFWWANHLEKDRAWRKWDAEKQTRAFYFNCCTINGTMNDKGTAVSRGRLNLMRYFVLVLDDIGQKTEAPPVEPTYKLESSIGSFQWGYALEPGTDLDRFEALIEAIFQLGFGDKGAGGSYRVMRVPGSANLKPGRQGFRSVITYWEPDRFWTLDELADAFGVDMDTVVVKDTTINTKSGGAVAMDGIDPMLDWLVDAGHVVADKGQWVDVVCPWADSHTSGSNTGGYSPLGCGTGDWVQTRAYRCLHEHCAERNLSAFVKWAEKLGGPYVSGYDPLPWLQERYAYVGMDMKVADMHQRVRGGDLDTWLWDFLPWSKRHPGKIAVPGSKDKIKVADAFVASGKSKHVDYTFYEPVSAVNDTGIVTVNGQFALNTYTPPNWLSTDKAPDMFLEHMAYVIPKKSERELFLDWLAFKFQNPKKRSYAMVMVADGVYGTGRSWIKDMLSLALQGKVKTASLAQLIGKGTAAEQNYNDWMSGCQFLVVEEAKETIDRDIFYHGYEVFKQNVDTRVGNERINPKFGRTRTEKIYFNALIFTNHSDALALPDNDRRVCVLMNASKMNTPEYYDRLEASTNDAEAARVYWYLMRRDVASYDHVYPISTPAKEAMIENNRSPADVLLDYFKDVHWSDLVTKRMVKDMVRNGAAKFDMDAISMKPGPVAGVIWGKLGTLKDVKNGLRLSIKGEQEAVRAIRNKEKWRGVAADGDVEMLLMEVEKERGVLKSLIN